MREKREQSQIQDFGKLHEFECRSQRKEAKTRIKMSLCKIHNQEEKQFDGVGELQFSFCTCKILRKKCFKWLKMFQVQEIYLRIKYSVNQDLKPRTSQTNKQLVHYPEIYKSFLFAHFELP